MNLTLNKRFYCCIKSYYFNIAKVTAIRQYNRQIFLIPIIYKNECFQNRNYASYRRKQINVQVHDPTKKETSFESYADQEMANTASEELLDYKVADDLIEVNNEDVTDDDNIKSVKKQPIKKEHDSLQFINFKLYEKVKKTYRVYLENTKSSQRRQSHDVFMVEGWRMCAEALKCGLKPKAIFYTRSRLLGQMKTILNKSERELAEYLNLFPLIKTPYKTMQLWSTLQTTPGMAGVFSLSRVHQLTSTLGNASLPLVVVLDQIKDPSNLGSIIRSLVAIGAQKIILMKGCCDIWDMKVIKTCCGGHFKMPFDTHVHWDTLSRYIPSDSTLYVAVSDSISETEDPPSNTKLNHIITQANIESEMQSSLVVDELSGDQFLVNESYNDEDHLNTFFDVDIPTQCYEDVEFYTPETKQLVLIIGGEVGLSLQAKKFALENHGIKLSIPLLNDIESLNNAVAASVIAFEIAKQFKKTKEKIVSDE